MSFGTEGYMRSPSPLSRREESWPDRSRVRRPVPLQHNSHTARCPFRKWTSALLTLRPPFDYERNGLDDFLVLNGRPWPTEGPVQLIAFFPDSDWVTSAS